MSSTAGNPFRPSFSLSATALTQLLASFACFLGAFVLPIQFPEFGTLSQQVLIILAVITLLLGTGNVLFGRQLSRLLTRAGKRSRVVIPREGVVYLAIMLTLAVGALLGHRNMPLLVFGMMAGPFVLNGWIVYVMLKKVSLTRRVPRRAMVGEFVVVEIEVSNGKRFLASHMLEVRDRVSGGKLSRGSRDEEGTVTYLRIPARDSRTGRYQLRFADRGQYQLGPIRVSSRFPLGIGERGQIDSQTSVLIVHPRVGTLLPDWQRQQKELSEASKRAQLRMGLFDDEFHRIREFRSGDNPRSIHWKSTAKRGQLMIREHQQNRHADSLVILDLPKSAAWDGETIEMAISLATTICVEQTKSSSGGHYLLAIAAKKSCLVPSRSPGVFREQALDALAMCQPSAKASLEDVLNRVVSEHALYDERIILITPRPLEATDALDRVSRESDSERLDLLSHTTIIEASLAAMAGVMTLSDDSTDDRRSTLASSSHRNTSDIRSLIAENSARPPVEEPA
ncbi:MAG: DUF58 domain-containing protein [Fuerstiella sp.]|jgi:uncharacterized protein (DUF58 family)|nr:DUF58 domain-containing protein [Fuerstiella sp.]